MENAFKDFQIKIPFFLGPDISVEAKISMGDNILSPHRVPPKIPSRVYQSDFGDFGAMEIQFSKASKPLSNARVRRWLLWCL